MGSSSSVTEGHAEGKIENEGYLVNLGGASTKSQWNMKPGHLLRIKEQDESVRFSGFTSDSAGFILTND